MLFIEQSPAAVVFYLVHRRFMRVCVSRKEKQRRWLGFQWHAF